MNLVDSSGWLEYFADGPNADAFAPAIEDVERLLISTVNLYEVYKWLALRHSEAAARQAVMTMQQARVIPVDARVALEAARLSIQHRLPMADSLIWATARLHDAVLWTQDADFQGLDRVRYIPHQAR